MTTQRAGSMQAAAISTGAAQTKKSRELLGSAPIPTGRARQWSDFKHPELMRETQWFTPSSRTCDITIIAVIASVV
jgi:hypothetical protein